MTLALAGAVALVPSEADACVPSPCVGAQVWHELEPLNAQAIPTDGVLLLQGARSGDSPDEDWLDKIELAVTRDGQPIAGALETSEIRGLLVWRPITPLAPGDYKAVGSLDNWDYDGYDNCSVDLELDFEFHVESEPSAPLSPPQVGTKNELRILEDEGFRDLVCCDGAMPYTEIFDCPSEERLSWGEGFCESHQGFGLLLVEASITTDLPPATSALVVRELMIDGQSDGGRIFDVLTASRSKPFCMAVRLTNIATGETVLGEESCHGNEPEIVAQLGQIAIDPSGLLAEECSQGAYTCELHVDGDRWDPEKCEPWPADEPTGGDPTEGPTSDGPGSDGTDGTDGTGGPASGGADELIEHGCACDTRAPPSPFAALALLGLAWVRPLRRRRSPG